MKKPDNNHPLNQMAARIATVLNDYSAATVKPEDVDLRMVAEFAWALGVCMDFTIYQLEDKQP